MIAREFHDRQHEKWALIRGNDNSSLAIFIHGFRGNHLTTWGILPELFVKNADLDEVLVHWDFLFLGYKTETISSYLDIAHLLSTQWELASRGQRPFAHEYRKLALFGHSLGTLGIRQFLCAKCLHTVQLNDVLSSVTLFGTPLNGSPFASMGRLFGGGPICDALKPNNPQLRMLRSWTDSVFPGFSWRSVKIILGADDRVVGSQYADLIKFPGDVDNPLVVNLDHGRIVKPAEWDKSIVRDIIVEALR
ncbi:hypothetical protein [Caballeronia novacaledonica]|uniref:Alpha/beta hydrolase family protein n=1 Tax=Caballeronia novacaledonica TaxID=1544861 RepID=A0AA37MKI1_9BURK|nr:hypothetical protein [Caballeronia novacaledonica]GJH30943.1 hypothetical protein CBA19CS42_40525 [Caballeronia novacaledonica]